MLQGNCKYRSLSFTCLVVSNTPFSDPEYSFVQAAMQHLENWLAGENAHEQHLLQQQNLLNLNAQLNNMNVAHQSFNSSGHTSIGNPVNPQQYDPNYPFNIPPPRPRPRNMAEAHVMTALDALTDGRNLYLMMPYCNGGELFDLLEKRTKFPEREAR